MGAVREPNVNGLYDIFNTVLNEISQKTSENRELKKLRDFLLPMLMNGQIKIEA